MINNIEALKKLCAVKEHVVEITGTGETIKLRELTVGDRADHLKWCKEYPEQFHLIGAMLVARSCPDLADSDAEELMSLGADYIQDLSSEVLKVSGLLSDSVDDEVKN
jgi:hypothetical protein